MFHFIAWDRFTGKRVAGIAPGLTCHRGEAFVHRVIDEVPFPVAAIRTDGGREFLGAFGLPTGQM
jgi:hypothetical protein